LARKKKKKRRLITPFKFGGGEQGGGGAVFQFYPQEGKENSGRHNPKIGNIYLGEKKGKGGRKASLLCCEVPEKGRNPLVLGGSEKLHSLFKNYSCDLADGKKGKVFPSPSKSSTAKAKKITQGGSGRFGSPHSRKPHPKFTVGYLGEKE